MWRWLDSGDGGGDSAKRGVRASDPICRILDSQGQILALAFR